jgi:shikimate kinase
MLYGPPAAGKLTIGTHLARLTGYKLFDNHVTIDWARAYFEFGTEPFWRLVAALRDAVFDESARQGQDLVFTFVYAHPIDLEHVERRLGEMERLGARVLLVQLHCEPEVLLKRVDAPDRVERGKLVDPEGLRDLLASRELFVAIPGRQSLRIDTAVTQPQQAALRIIEHFGLPAGAADATQ